MRDVFVREFDWLRREPFRLVPVINSVKDDNDAIAVRDLLHQRAHGLGDQALSEYVLLSRFLSYNEKKIGFAVDRPVQMMNGGKHERLKINLRGVASALANRTGLWNEEAEH